MNISNIIKNQELSNNKKKVTDVDRLKVLSEVHGQKYYCLSILSPKGARNTDICSIRIGGSYDTKKEAEERAVIIRDEDPLFDVYVGEVGKWCPLNPDPNSIKDQHYHEKELQKIMEEKMKNEEKAKRMQEERKEDMIRTAAGNEQRANLAKARLQKKHAAKYKNSENDSKNNGLVNTNSNENLNNNEPKNKKSKNKNNNNNSENNNHENNHSENNNVNYVQNEIDVQEEELKKYKEQIYKDEMELEKEETMLNANGEDTKKALNKKIKEVDTLFKKVHN